MKIKEVDLFEPINKYLEAQGYAVHSEVRHCDIVAEKDDDIIIVELKTSFSVALLAQAVQRKELVPSVYVAVPLDKSKGYPKNFRGIKSLCRHLEIGLIFVRFLKKNTRVEVIIHPQPFKPRMRKKQYQAIIREINGRFAEFNKAGSAAVDKKISAYRQQALLIAWLLNNNNEMSPKSLKDAGASQKAQSILSKNFYGWFEREKRGIYSLSKAGNLALEEYSSEVKEIVAVYKKSEYNESTK